MNPDDYKKVKEIFNSALEVEPEGRGAFLDERCDGENGLREEVERLLRSYDSEYLGQPAVVEIAIELTGDGLLGGQHIGHYTILEKIGSGGMGEVYLAEDGKLGRHVAIKLLPEVFTNDIDRLDRFQREARTASALNHPNILTIHEIGETDHTHYIATEYIDGETLRQKLNRGPFDDSECSRCCGAGRVSADGRTRGRDHPSRYQT
jgi:serine/threonine protein kinase